jgi:hypothetical protein
MIRDILVSAAGTILAVIFMWVVYCIYFKITERNTKIGFDV